jgi:hypothetical protein
VSYALNQWNELNVFHTDGAVPIDYNICNREMKRRCLNRKSAGALTMEVRLRERRP